MIMNLKVYEVYVKVKPQNSDFLKNNSVILITIARNLFWHILFLQVACNNSLKYCARNVLNLGNVI